MKNSKAYAWNITVNNNTPREIAIKLYEQLPVSQNEDIKIEDIMITPELDKKPSKGIFVWDETITAKSKSAFSLKFIVEYPKNKKVSGL